MALAVEERARLCFKEAAPFAGLRSREPEARELNWTLASFAAAEGDEASTADSLNRQVAELYAAGKYQEAIPLARQLLEITEKLNGLEHGDTVASLNNLAALYRMTGDYAEAEPLYRQALAIREKNPRRSAFRYGNQPQQSNDTLQLDRRLRQSRSALPACIGDS
jgi:tetratricopeptide (TPR) repeat protein